MIKSGYQVVLHNLINMYLQNVCEYSFFKPELYLKSQIMSDIQRHMKLKTLHCNTLAGLGQNDSKAMSLPYLVQKGRRDPSN